MRSCKGKKKGVNIKVRCYLAPQGKGKTLWGGGGRGYGLPKATASAASGYYRQNRGERVRCTLSPYRPDERVGKHRGVKREWKRPSSNEKCCLTENVMAKGKGVEKNNITRRLRISPYTGKMKTEKMDEKKKGRRVFSYAR